jgi:hypothetical protein
MNTLIPHIVGEIWMIKLQMAFYYKKDSKIGAILKLQFKIPLSVMDFTLHDAIIAF